MVASTGGKDEVRRLARLVMEEGQFDRMQPSAEVIRYMSSFDYGLEEIAEWIVNCGFKGVEENDPNKGGPPSVDGWKYNFRSPRAGWSETVCIITEDETGRKLFIITSPHPSRR